MPHSQNDRLISAKQKHRRSGSHQSKEKQEKPKAVSKDLVKSQMVTESAGPSVQPPIEQPRPWSPWIPGDDGRWFYQGRLKADGSGWEYQFTEGYPLTPRRREPTVYPTLTQAPPYNPPVAGPAVPDESPEPPIGIMDREDDGDDETDRQLPPQVPVAILAEQSQALILVQPATTRPATAITKPGSARQAVGKHSDGRAGKKLGAIVKADKERRINSRKRVKSWLSEVTP